MRAHSGGLRPPKYDSGLGESGSPPDECTQMMAPVRCGFATVSPWLLGRRDHVTGKATASSTPERAIGTPPYPACTGRVLPVERPRMQCGPAGLRGRILYSSVCTQCTLRTVRPPVCTPLGNQLNMASRSSTTTWSPSAERVVRNTVRDGLISACTVATVYSVAMPSQWHVHALVVNQFYIFLCGLCRAQPHIVQPAKIRGENGGPQTVTQVGTAVLHWAEPFQAQVYYSRSRSRFRSISSSSRTVRVHRL